mgnify:CR=1 FL=1
MTKPVRSLRLLPKLLTLIDDVLPETTVKIYEENGTVNVTFTTGSEEAATLLSKHQAGLAEHLKNHLSKGGDVKVTVNHSGGGDESGTEGESRGKRSVFDENNPLS